MKIAKKCGYLILSMVFLASCDKIQNPNNSTINNTVNSFNTNKEAIDKLQTIIVKDKIVLSKPEDLNSEKIKKEIDEITAHQMNSDEEYRVSYWSNSVLKWNQIARELVIKYKTNSPEASRVYALLSVGQYDALVNAYQNKYLYNRMFRTTSKTPSYPSEKTTVAQVSSDILTYLYPNEKDFLEKKAQENKETAFWGNESLRSDMAAGEEIGKNVALKVIEKAKIDHADKANEDIDILQKEGIWSSSKVPTEKGLLPSWGKVTPWLVESVDTLPVKPPPAFNSEEFKKDVDELIQVTNNLTDEQKKSVELWFDASGTYTSSGHWNLIADDLITKNRFVDLYSSYILSYMNIAMMDAGICSWSVKYKYQLLRPSQANKDVKMIVDLPNFPSYTSENSSFAGAASEVLKFIFPKNKDELDKMALDASMSGMYSGIHYRFDNEEGLKNGKNLGNLSVNLMKSNSL